jgi:hypothetical protein
MQKLLKLSWKAKFTSRDRKRYIGARQPVLMDYNAKFDSVHQGQVAFGRLSTKPANYTNYRIKMKKGLVPNLPCFIPVYQH